MACPIDIFFPLIRVMYEQGCNIYSMSKLKTLEFGGHSSIFYYDDVEPHNATRNILKVQYRGMTTKLMSF